MTFDAAPHPFDCGREEQEAEDRRSRPVSLHPI
jgi:hypothetical protein